VFIVDIENLGSCVFYKLLLPFATYWANI